MKAVQVMGVRKAHLVEIPMPEAGRKALKILITHGTT